ncbi:FKBP-type peptidyl-prolyl cis-trans isomerase [Haliea sp. E1-2-M8]|uniref:FKBP-type peptidyl-prolyl cis-trans isomerase n=1 Tax=Haliea sp. E1-2-M8 TaxID=3064706 RepID=UPI002725D559|nr:FKBP-type peptidyl-prolyl cis-trans isomerase [Haliea sp. E1-2-M8]MDO8861778.1 FKBP-type peptidyl-prolyl cis-trans isomerase [Haliea sp. E1-2-M8]
MKKFALPLALVATVTLQACNQESAPEADTDTAAADEVMLEDSTQRLSYGIAYGLGQRMAADSVPMDVPAFTAGLEDALEGAEPRMTEEEIQQEMTAYQQKAMEEQQELAAAAAEANQAAAEAFLAENAAREGVVVTESGLQYEVIAAGEGDSPGPEDTVEVHYRGTLVDGTEFDSSYKRGETVTFGVSQVIAGWTEALQLMAPGAKWNLYIPSDLAYGPGGAGNLIGPNAALVFEVELIDIASPDAEAAAEETSDEPSDEG